MAAAPENRPGLAPFLRGALFYFLLIGWTLFYGVLVTPLLLAPRAFVLAAARFWNRAVMAMVQNVAGIGCEIRGRENIPARPAVIAVKHHSAFETLALPLILGDPLFVVKRELFWIPIFGWYLARLGHIAIDRTAGPRALKAIIRRADRALGSGHHVIIFPEGTRVAAGQTRAYGPGVAALYTMLDVPVVPVALNSGLFWRRRALAKTPGTVRIAFLPAIAPGLPREAFMAELARRIEAATDRLLAETVNPAAGR